MLPTRKTPPSAGRLSHVGALALRILMAALLAAILAWAVSRGSGVGELFAIVGLIGVAVAQVASMS